MKNIEIKEMTKEQRETWLYMSIKSWMELVVIDAVESKIIDDYFASQLKLRIRIFNNIRVMQGRITLNAHSFMHNLP